jgi:hypothetical protein
MFSSFSKIAGVMAIFKIGNRVFEQIKKPIVNLFAEIVKQATNAGEDATDGFYNGIKKKQREIV